MLEKIIRNQSSWGLFFLRLTIALIFLVHGSQKVTTLFGGEGFSGTEARFAALGIFYPTLLAYLMGWIELGGGILLFLGLMVREASLILIFIMLGAVWTVHGANGFFSMNQGYEYNLTLIGALLCLFLSGGGAVSMDRVLFPRERWTFIKDPSKVRLEPPLE